MQAGGRQGERYRKSTAGELAYQQALWRAKSVAGALKVKKKRKRITQGQNALREENFEAWFEVNKRKRIVASPISAARRAGVALRKCRRTLASARAADADAETVAVPAAVLDDLASKLDDLDGALTRVIEGVGPMAMAVAQCRAKQQDIEERITRVTTRSHDLSRALMRACQEVFNADQVWLYANGDFAHEILPTSMYHLRTWVANKRVRKQREAATSGGSGESGAARGNAAGNAPSLKPIGKSQTNAKRAAHKERQDMGDSMVDHVPVCVADPTSYAGLAGVVSNGGDNAVKDEDQDV